MSEHDSRMITILLVVAAFVLVPIVLVGAGRMGGGRMMGGGAWGHGTMSGWSALVAGGVALLCLAVFVGGGYLLFEAVASDRRDSDQALAELRAAYARGDLTDEEYERRREVLERDAESQPDLTDP